MQRKLKFTGLIASVLIISNSFSQVSKIGNVQPFLQNISYNNDFTNVVIAFHKRFSNAENVSWFNVNKKFGADFKINDLKYRVLLNRKGRLMYQITCGKEKLLPVDIRKLVKSNYVEFLITATFLVEEANRKIWVINLEDESRYVMVRFENNEMEETMNARKKH